MKDCGVLTDRGELNFSSLSLYRNAVYGVAAIWIVLFHGVILDKVEFSASLSFFKDTLELGNIGVDIFLLLSGIGLYFSYSKKPRLGQFYYRRFVRIYLPYLLIAIPYLVYACLIRSRLIGIFIMKVFTVWFWVGDDKPLKLWFIPAMLLFYLLYPLIYKVIFFREKGAFLRTLLLVLLTFGLTVIAFYYAKDFYSRFDQVLPRLGVFILGCYLGKLVKEKRRMPVLVVIIGMMVIAGAYPLYARAVLHGVWRRYYGSLTGVALTFVLPQLFVGLSRIKLDKFFAFFGGFSLEIYLATIVARTIYSKTTFYGDHAWRNYLIAMAGAMVIAYLISMLEKPILKALMPVKKKT